MKRTKHENDKIIGVLTHRRTTQFLLYVQLSLALACLFRISSIIHLGSSGPLSRLYDLDQKYKIQSK